MSDPLSPQWMSLIGSIFETPKMRALSVFLNDEKSRGKTIYPRPKHFFRALDLCPPDNVKVVILGQDPYHGPGQAEGLSFSVPQGVPAPPSLKNILKELTEDLNIPSPPHGHLGAWADEGVLLLNSVLSVEAHQAASHAGRGWEEFTDEIIRKMNEGAPKVFILWGAYAQKKRDMLIANDISFCNRLTLRLCPRIVASLGQNRFPKQMPF